MSIDWRKKIISEAFSGKEIPKKNRPETMVPSVTVSQIPDVKTQLDVLKKEFIKEVKDSVIKDLKSSKSLDITDLKNGHTLIYPNKKVQDLRWHGGGGTGTVDKSQFVSNETPGGAVNGINLVYTTLDSFTVSSTHLYLNGLRQQLNNDYTESGANQITFALAPLAGDMLVIDYIKA